SVRRALMIALDQMEGSPVTFQAVQGELASPEPSNREAAAWVAGHHPEWGLPMAAWFAGRLRSKDLTEADREALAHQLAKLAKAREIRDLIGATLIEADSTPEARGIALRAMAEASPKSLPAEWREGLASSVASGEPWLVRLAVTTARGLAIKEDETGLLSR